MKEIGRGEERGTKKKKGEKESDLNLEATSSAK